MQCCTGGGGDYHYRSSDPKAVGCPRGPHFFTVSNSSATKTRFTRLDHTSLPRCTLPANSPLSISPPPSPSCSPSEPCCQGFRDPIGCHCFWSIHTIRSSLCALCLGTGNLGAHWGACHFKCHFKLIVQRIGAFFNHTDKPRAHVEDTLSKTLVTRDLNAGKSTFANAIPGRPVMPVDQQPCTTAFCEVHNAAEIGGVKEIHIVKEGIAYDLSDESTFTRTSLSALDEVVSENEYFQQIVRVYLTSYRKGK